MIYILELVCRVKNVISEFKHHPCHPPCRSVREKEYALKRQKVEILQYFYIMINRDRELYRFGMISKSEYERRVRAENERAEKCKKEVWEPLCSCLACCWIAEPCWQENPWKKKACAASVSGMFYGGIMTGVGAARSWPFCLGTGISAIVLGVLTATGLCVDEFCCSDSNPVEVPSGVTLGSPAVIYQPDR